MHLYLLGLYITASRTEQHQKNIDVTKFKLFNYQIIEVLGGGGYSILKQILGRGGGGQSH